MIYKNYVRNITGNTSKVNDYLELKDNRLFYKGIDLLELVKNYSDPLEVAYTTIIEDRILLIKKLATEAIRHHKYPGSFTYAYASKANYFSEVVTTALNAADALEITSSYDLDIVEYLFKKNIITRDRLIICNGFKFDRYLTRLFYLKKQGLNLRPIIENVDELNAIIDSGLEFEIGLRLNVDEYPINHSHAPTRLSSRADTRFGLTFKEMVSAAKRLKNYPKLKFTTFHIHFGGMIEDIPAYIKAVKKIFTENYAPIKKIYPELHVLDLGGGLPAQYNLRFNFDYTKLINDLVKTLGQAAKRINCEAPDLIGEYGRYTVNDHSFFIFKVILEKSIPNQTANWYIINGSIMTHLPDSWALGQEFLILPINGWEREGKQVRLGGITCDPDDILHDKQRIFLPEFSQEKELYIGVFGVGAYQEMISGIGGVHHCLLPEGCEVIIYKKDGRLVFNQITPKQSAKDVLVGLDYHKKHPLEDYTHSSSAPTPVLTK